jgi:beta-glucosidase
MSAAAVRGLQKAGTYSNGAIAACVKHYLADGGLAWGTGRDGKIDQGNALGGEALLRQIHLPPYVSAVHEGAYSVMVQYGSWQKPDTLYPEDFHASHFWLTRVLKRELGFDGIVLTDCQGYGTIEIRASVPDTLRERVRMAINAGVDMLMACDGYINTLDRLKTLINGGQIPMARVNDAVRRILRVKYHLGLFDNATVDRARTAQIGSAAHRAVARQCVQQSCVLLKNQNSRLPLAKTGQRIAVVGLHSDSVALLCGGWSMGWGTSVEPIVGTTVLDGIKALVSDTTNVIYSSSGSSGIATADIAVVVSGETQYAEWFGDNANPRLPSWTRTAIDNCYNAGKPVVLVLISGRPLLFEGYDTKCDAILAAWLPGTEANGVADVLFGDYRPTGKLAHSWPDTLIQIPINLGDAAYAPMYPYGYGLTY